MFSYQNDPTVIITDKVDKYLEALGERILFAKLGEEKYCTHSRFPDNREESYN